MGIPTNEQNLAPGADPVADVQRVERQLLPAAINAAATTTVKSGPGYVGTIRVLGGTLVGPAIAQAQPRALVRARAATACHPVQHRC